MNQKIDQGIVSKFLRQGEFCDALLYTAFCQDEVGSLESLRSARQRIITDQNPDAKTIFQLNQIVGSAHQLMLDLGTAYRFYREPANPGRLAELKQVALWMGNDPELIEQISLPPEYRVFLEQKALANLPVCRQGPDYFVDPDRLQFVFDEMQKQGIDQEAALDKTISEIISAKNDNTPRLLSLAKAKKDQTLVEKVEGIYKRKQSSRREDIESKIRIACAAAGHRYLGRVQEGDYGVFFPTAAHLFKIRTRTGVEVWKEDLRLYTDFGRLDGYNQEKQIYESFQHPNMIDYLGSVAIGPHEFLRFAEFPGEELTPYTKGRQMDKDELVRVTITLAKLLADLHKADILYLDIKPKNILYDGNRLALLDFGMARQGVSEARSLISTPEFVQPEMAQNLTADQKSDIFQLGILLYEMMTGSHPYAGFDFREGEEYRESEVIKYSLPNRWNRYEQSRLAHDTHMNQIVETMLAKDQYYRPTASGLVEALKVYQRCLV